MVRENLRPGQVHIREKYEDGSTRYRAFPPIPAIKANFPGAGPGGIVQKAAKRAAQRSKGKR